MKVFISSVIVGMELYRDAALRAARALRHDARRAEDFGASPESPQQTCLAGVRWADIVILILGPRYGNHQKSGLSATHEEYQEAKGRCSLLAFAQERIEREPSQEAFLREVRDWTTGSYTAAFRTPEDLHDAVIRALHEFELSRAVGPIDDQEMLGRATGLIPEEPGFGQPTVTLVVAGGPRQQILRPVQLEDQKLERMLKREALFGDSPVLDPEFGTTRMVQGDALILQQDHASMLLDQQGTVRIVQPARRDRDRSRMELPVLIEEEVRDLIYHGLRFAGWVLDHIDSLKRISDVVPIVSLQRGGLSWRTRAEHEESPTTVQIPMGPNRIVVNLSPPRRHRAALTQDSAALAEDFTVLLRRKVRS